MTTSPACEQCHERGSNDLPMQTLTGAWLSRRNQLILFFAVCESCILFSLFGQVGRDTNNLDQSRKPKQVTTGARPRTEAAIADDRNYLHSPFELDLVPFLLSLKLSLILIIVLILRCICKMFLFFFLFFYRARTGCWIMVSFFLFFLSPPPPPSEKYCPTFFV